MLAAKRRNPTFCNPDANNAEFYFIRGVMRLLKLFKVSGRTVITWNSVALCRPVPEINQLAAFTTKRPPGIVVPASEAFALWAGVSLGGFLGRAFVSHD